MPGAGENSKPQKEQALFIRTHRVTGRTGNGRSCSIHVTRTIESEFFAELLIQTAGHLPKT